MQIECSNTLTILSHATRHCWKHSNIIVILQATHVYEVVLFCYDIYIYGVPKSRDLAWHLLLSYYSSTSHGTVCTTTQLLYVMHVHRTLDEKRRVNNERSAKNLYCLIYLDLCAVVVSRVVYREGGCPPLLSFEAGPAQDHAPQPVVQGDQEDIATGCREGREEHGHIY